MSEAAPALQPPLTVGELTRRIKKILEDNIKFVCVAGEISNLKSNNHLYFSLKDADAQIPCAMWRSFASRLRFRPENGMQVIAFGRVEVYAPHGKYQLIVERMEPQGVGALQLRFEQMKLSLAREGLFDEARKRPLPKFPRTVAILTSPTGAALRDMLRILTGRYPKITVFVCPVPVQGEAAAGEIARMIGAVNLQRPDVDVLIVGRGGGSMEDLWAFNEEVVARAIFTSRIPVVSAVGHETDFTIADFVADVRAATPTHAAGLVVPDLREILDTLRRHEETLARRPLELLEQQLQRTDELRERLREALPRTLQGIRQKLSLFASVFGQTTPRFRSQLDRHRDNLNRLLEQRWVESKRKVETGAAKLHALSPLLVLSRGYSITLDPSGHSLVDASRVKPGDEIRTRLQQGEVRSRVESTGA